jgi:hypothetical protein
MGNFPGGSAWAMAKDIAEGYLLVTDRTFMRLLPAELEQLAFEIDRALREVRGDQPSLDDQPALQQRNRKITRLNQGLTILRAHQQRRRPAAAAPAAGAPGAPGGKGGSGGKGGPAGKGPTRA